MEIWHKNNITMKRMTVSELFKKYDFESILPHLDHLCHILSYFISTAFVFLPNFVCIFTHLFSDDDDDMSQKNFHSSFAVSKKMLNFACRTGNCQFYQAKNRMKFARARWIFSTGAPDIQRGRAGYSARPLRTRESRTLSWRVTDSLPPSPALSPRYSAWIKTIPGGYQPFASTQNTFHQQAKDLLAAGKIIE